MLADVAMNTRGLARCLLSALSVAVSSTAVSGCASASKPAPVSAPCPRPQVTRGSSAIVAQLESIASKDPNTAGVWVNWGGEEIPVRPGMWLKRGDVVSTGQGARVVLKFLEENAEVVLQGDTKVEVGSLFTWFGNLFVSGRLNTSTKYAEGAVRGTKYHVSVDKASSRVTFSVIEGAVTVSPVAATVVDGHVQVSPTQAKWRPFTLVRQQRAVLTGDQKVPPAPAPIPPAQVEEWRKDVATVPGVGKELASELAKLSAAEAAAPAASSAELSQYVYTPDLTGASWAAALRSVSAAGLRLDPESAALGKGDAKLRIVSQDPVPRTVLERGSTLCVVAVDSAQAAKAVPAPVAHSCAGFKSVGPQKK